MAMMEVEKFLPDIDTSIFKVGSVLPKIDFPNISFTPQTVRLAEDDNPFSQLVILGNGFDLFCGLKSSYRNFFDYIFEKRRNVTTKNYWYSLFEILNQNGSFENWTDVELQILSELKNVDALYSRGVFREGKTVSNNSFIDELSFYRDLWDDLESKKITCRLLKYYFKEVWSTDMIPSQLKIRLKLKQDLRELEEDFRQYLCDEVRKEFESRNYIFEQGDSGNSENYFLKSLLLITYIIGFENSKYPFKNLLSGVDEKNVRNFDELMNECDSFGVIYDEDDDEIARTSILSFNYTQPFSNPLMRNIHGKLEENNIIFGIDYDKLVSNFEDLPTEFSKSYRILENNEQESMSIAPSIDVIKFYGHGLGTADYSYFQSIFDTINLYNGNTKLIFLWSSYDGADKNTLRLEQVRRVTKLIEEYGQTFTNKDHGRNLLTKLQLENRLSIVEVDKSTVWKGYFVE